MFGDLSVGEFVADLGVFALQCRGGVGQRVAFVTDRCDVAELAAERCSLRECALELVLGTSERGGEPGAIDEVGILGAAEASFAGCGQPVELATEEVASFGECACARVEFVEPCQFGGRQRVELRAQPLELLSPTVVVDNNGPPAPSSVTATAVGDGSDTIDLSWSDPASPPQPVSGAFAQLCQTACGTEIAINGSGGAQLTAPGPGTYAIRLWLVDQAGRGSATDAATTAVSVPTPPTTTPTGARTSKPKVKASFTLGSLSWHNGLLTLTVTGLPEGTKLHVDLEYPHHPLLRVIIAREHLRLHTPRPRLVVLRVFVGKHQEGATVYAHVA